MYIILGHLFHLVLIIEFISNSLMQELYYSHYI